MSTASDGLPIYGFEITYMRHDGETAKCHYVGTLQTAERKAMRRPLAMRIVQQEAFSEPQWVRTFGKGRM